MKISNKVLNDFNNGKIPTFNEHYNKNNGLPTMEQFNFLIKVRSDKFGIMNGKITRNDINKYLENNLKGVN